MSQAHDDALERLRAGGEPREIVAGMTEAIEGWLECANCDKALEQPWRNPQEILWVGEAGARVWCSQRCSELYADRVGGL